jgi:hypothetical protein
MGYQVLKTVYNCRNLRMFINFKTSIYYEVTGDWRKLYNEELHNLYFSPNIIRMIKSSRMRWAGHMALMMRRGMHIGYFWESQKEGDH